MNFNCVTSEVVGCGTVQAAEAVAADHVCACGKAAEVVDRVCATVCASADVCDVAEAEAVRSRDVVPAEAEAVRKVLAIPRRLNCLRSRALSLELHPSSQSLLQRISSRQAHP